MVVGLSQIYPQLIQQLINLNRRIMLNMKKLIDETDFDNLSELTKRWGNSTHGQKSAPVVAQQSEKQNDCKKSNEIVGRRESESKTEEQADFIAPDNTRSNYNPTPKPTAARKNKVVPQVIDEDTEHFKNKLEHLLNIFKTDAVSQFMNMKKQMLDYQQECVKSDTHKYLTMYQEKHKQLLQTKQKLLETSREAEKKTAQVQKLSEHIAKLNERMKIYKYVSRPYSVLFQNMVRGKELKFKMREAVKFDERRLKRKSIWGWVGVYKAEKSQRQKVESQERIQREVNDIVGKFQKQMDMLKQRLAEATRKNEQYENNKHILQQNLKKAFLRGVCAMNMEAMGVLGSENAEQNDWVSEKQKTQREKSVVANNLSYMEPKASIMTREDINQNQSMFVPKITASRASNPNPNLSGVVDQKSQNLITITQKAESKNYKWKEAPILGVEQAREEDQPRMQVVRPTTQGKVIKVVEGKSTVEVKKAGLEKPTITNSRKKI